MILNNSVKKHQISGDLQNVIEEIKQFEASFKAFELKEPNIPGYFALANTYKAEPDTADFFNFISKHYKILPANEALSRINEIIKSKHLIDYTAIAKWSRHIHVSIKDGNSTSFIYINSYDKKLKEEIIIAPLFYKVKFVHRKSGLNKTTVEKLLDFLNEGGVEYEKAISLLNQDDTVSKRDLYNLIKTQQLPVRKILLNIFSYDGEYLRTNKGHDDLMVDSFFSKFGSSAKALIEFTNALYSLYVQEQSFDKATVLISSISDYVTKKHLKPLSSLAFI